MTEQRNTGPAFQSRIGSVRVAVWSRDTDKGRFHNVRIVRQYQKDGEWHETPTFNGLSDLVHVEEAICTVKAWLLAEQAEHELVRRDQAQWMKRLERGLDNIRTALRWADKTNIEAGLQLISSLWRFWNSGNVREGALRLSQLLAHEAYVAPPIKAKALWVHAKFSQSLYDEERARALLEESLSLYQDLGDRQ